MFGRSFDSIEERLDYIEYRQHLLFANTAFSRCLFEHRITYREYVQVANLITKLRDKIEEGNKVNKHEYERMIYDLVPFFDDDHHFCEDLAKVYFSDQDDFDLYQEIYSEK